MREDIEFKTIQELYNRIYPALMTKKDELFRMKKNYIKETDIWNYMLENVWKKKHNLTIADMVSDIFEIDDLILDEYVLNILNKEPRKVNLDDEML